MNLNGDTLIVQNARTARLKLGIPDVLGGGFAPMTIPFLTDGGGVAIVAGQKGWLRLPGNMTLTRWELFADQAGSIEFDILRATYANLPAFASIAGADLPTLAAAQKNQSSALTGWTLNLMAGDWISFVVNSAATITRATVVLVGNRTS